MIKKCRHNNQRHQKELHNSRRAKLKPGASSPGAKQDEDKQTKRPTNGPTDEERIHAKRNCLETEAYKFYKERI